MRRLLYKIKCCWHVLFANNFSVFTDNGASYWSYLSGNKYFVLYIGTFLDKALDKYLENTDSNNTNNEEK